MVESAPSTLLRTRFGCASACAVPIARRPHIHATNCSLHWFLCCGWHLFCCSLRCCSCPKRGELIVVHRRHAWDAVKELTIANVVETPHGIFLYVRLGRHHRWTRGGGSVLRTCAGLPTVARRGCRHT